MKYRNKLIKYTTVFILAAVLFTACQASENKEASLQPEQATESHSNNNHESSAELSLNNGSKWKTDSVTNKNVMDLYNIIADANPVVLEDYQKTGKVLQTEINKIVSECRMQGADHEALHHWLEPFMEINKKLLVVSSAEEGKELFGIVKKHLEKYAEYFEVNYLMQ